MKSLIKPPFLNQNDKIAIVSLASWCDPKYVAQGVEILKNWGLDPIVYPSALRQYNTFGGPDSLRIKDFQTTLDDPEIKAIISTRGGYGSCRIIDGIDFTNFAKSPKWLIGFSDITTVHLAFQSLGYCSLHGPMLSTFERDLNSLQQLKDLLFGGAMLYQFESHHLNKTGNSKGKAVGGNLSLLVQNIGSKYPLDFKNKILFLEDIAEESYSIDRMIVQLKRANLLNDLAGLVVGNFTPKKDFDDDYGLDANQIIAEHTSEFSYPKAFNFQFGHEKVNNSIVMGDIIELDVKDSQVTLTTFQNIILA